MNLSVNFAPKLRLQIGSGANNSIKLKLSKAFILIIVGVASDDCLWSIARTGDCATRRAKRRCANALLASRRGNQPKH